MKGNHSKHKRIGWDGHKVDMHLVGATDEIEVVFLEKSLQSISPECERYPAVIFCPSTALVGIRPQQVAHQAEVGNWRWAVELTDLVHTIEFGGQTPVHTEDFFCHNGRYREAIEAISKGLKYFHTLSPLAWA